VGAVVHSDRTVEQSRVIRCCKSREGKATGTES